MKPGAVEAVPRADSMPMNLPLTDRSAPFARISAE